MMMDFKKDKNMKLSELTSNGCHFINRGKYDEIIEYILSKFPRKNLYIGISEEIRANKKKHYNDIFKFLGATKLNKIDEDDVHVRTYERSIPKKLEEKLFRIYKPHNEKLYKILGRKIDIWEKYYDELKLGLTNGLN